MPDRPAKSETPERAAAALYLGEVMHARLKPIGHRFSYRVMSLLIEFIGRRSSLTDAALLRAFFALPLVTLKIVAAIRWEALRLWLKGARLVPRPM